MQGYFIHAVRGRDAHGWSWWSRRSLWSRWSCQVPPYIVSCSEAKRWRRLGVKMTSMAAANQTRVDTEVTAKLDSNLWHLSSFFLGKSSHQQKAVRRIKALCKVMSNKCCTYSAAMQWVRWLSGIQNQVQEDQVVLEDPGYQGWDQSQNLKLDHVVNDVWQSPLQTDSRGDTKSYAGCRQWFELRCLPESRRRFQGLPEARVDLEDLGFRPVCFWLNGQIDKTCSHTTVTPQSFFAPKKAPNSY